MADGGVGRPDLLTARELAKELRVSERTIFGWIRERGLPVIRFSPRAIRFDRAMVIRWMESLPDREGITEREDANR